MPAQPRPTRAEYDSALTPEYLHITRVMHAAFMGGPVVYAAGLLVLYFSAGEPDAHAVQSMETLSMANAGVTIMAYLLAPFLFSRALTGTRLDPGQEANTPRELAFQALLLLRTAIIVRMAVLEGAALFGVSVCVIGVTGGTLYAEPLYWLNLGSGALLIAFGVFTFPAREGLLDILESHFSAGPEEAGIHTASS